MGRAKCERCMFRAPEGADYRCDYCAVTGHTRLAVPPEMCLHFREGKRIDRSQEKTEPFHETVPRTMARHGGRSTPKYNWRWGKVLYDQGKNDVEISRELGCDPHTVYRWRRKLGLTANAGARGKPIRRNMQEESNMKEETKTYVKTMLDSDLERRRSDLDRVLLQGGDGKRELERYRAALLARDDFTSGRS